MPDSYFVVRNENGAPTLPLVSLGGVLLKKLTIPLVTAATAQDNPVSLLRPLDVALNATGLNACRWIVRGGRSIAPFQQRRGGIQQSADAIYVQNTAVPRWSLAPGRRCRTNRDRGSDVIPAGTGFIIRKAVSDGQPDFWTNNFPVQAVSAVSRKTHSGSGRLRY